ncbi:dockerin type I domain-containing protein [Herbivorax sp. ANBcel31]|uniref:dockerin type I domain-containing protein n=1 Tax=Herbivorax sp. ANBcel31 TaxID=3069754 RepID=UPI0027B1BF78|nr:dockerin type I domain-containing protein [Herbivorax sp. ANBcel31]MDQ2086552.1 dockerin type I domain-containing protein [Herbivorax sp. ANBcel31]
MKKPFKNLSKIYIFIILLLFTFVSISSESQVTANNISISYGDINGDGNIDSTDVTLLKRYLLDIISELPYSNVADLNGDNSIDSTDYTLLRRYVLQIMNVFPVEGLSDDSQSSSNLTSSEELLLEFINQTRSDAGIEPFKCDMDIVDVARIKSQEMIDDSFFSSTSPTYGTTNELLNYFDIPFDHAYETVSISPTATSAFNFSSQIDIYNEIITDPSYNYAGVGIIRCPTRGLVVVQIFISR